MIKKEGLSEKDIVKRIESNIISKQPFEVERFSVSWKMENVTPFMLDKIIIGYMNGVIHDKLHIFNDVYFFNTVNEIIVDWIFKYIYLNTKSTVIKTYKPENLDEIKDFMANEHPFKIEGKIITFYEERKFITPSKYEVGSVIDPSMKAINFDPTNYDMVLKVSNYLNGFLIAK